MNQRHKENLKLAGLDGSDSGTLTHSGETDHGYPFFRALISPCFVSILRVLFLRASMVSEPRHPTVSIHVSGHGA